MNKFLTGLALLLAALYAVYFTDWFKPAKIQIMYRSLPDRNIDANTAEPVIFYFDHQIKVKSLKVCESSEYATNHSPHLLWNMVAVSNAVPLTDFPYGNRIHGMKPFIPKQQAEPLQPRTTYLLLVDGEKIKAEKEFKPRTGG